jgi:hypothetical protein
MARNKKRKFVTLPIAAKMMYESLANIAWRVEKESAKGKPGINKDDFHEYILQVLGKDAFLYSFTPSGEIGSGDSDHRDNPGGKKDKRPSGRISFRFYDLFRDEIGPRGRVTERLSGDKPNAKVFKNRLFRFKSAVVNLVQLYVESSMKEWDSRNLIKADGRQYDSEGNRIGGIKSAYNESNETSFSYRRRRKDEGDEEWFKYLVRVEMNRYLRLFVATFYMQVICKLIDTDINSMAKYIDKLNLAGINKLDNDRDKFSLLKYVPNREEFVLKIKDAFTTDAIVKLLQAKVSSEEQLSIIDQELLPATEKLKKTKKQLKENKETRQKKE